MLRYDKYKHSNAFHMDKAAGKDVKKFYTKAGTLSRYALACGYIENRHVIAKVPTIQGYEMQDVRCTLEADSACFHVRATSADFRLWDSYESLTEARKAFKKVIKDLKCSNLKN
jgi:hypothetical protein